MIKAVGKVTCYGTVFASETWRCDHIEGIQRLYYIHSGTGGCVHNGQKYAFTPGHLYYIPFSKDFKPYSQPGDPILHTYVDFERIPPIMTRHILSADTNGNEALAAATAVFQAGAKAGKTDGEGFGRLCAESILYLTSFLARENHVSEISDPVVLTALTAFHEKISQPLRIDDLARECYMTPDSFIRRFKKVMGITPYGYFKRLRLYTARRLHADGLSYEAIAPATGYSDTSALLHALAAQKD